MFVDKLKEKNIYDMFWNEMGWQYSVVEILPIKTDEEGNEILTVEIERKLYDVPEDSDDDDYGYDASRIVRFNDFACETMEFSDIRYQMAMFKIFGNEYLQAVGEAGYSISKILSTKIIKDIYAKKQTTFTQLAPTNHSLPRDENPFPLKPEDKNQKTTNKKIKNSNPAQIVELTKQNHSKESNTTVFGG